MPRRINQSEFDQLVYGGRIPFVEALTEERAAYNEVIRIYAMDGYFSDDYSGEPIAPLPGTLRSDIILTGNNAVPNVLEFNFRTNQTNVGMGTVGNADNRLDDNDAFVVREIGLLWGCKASAVAENSSAVLQQWPNNATATGLIGGGFGTAAESVNRALQGNMSIEVNAVKYMDKLGCLEFQYSDQAQMGTLLFTASNQAANSMMGSKGWKSMIPQLRFAGSDKATFTVQIPAPLTFVVGTTPLIASLQLRGLKVQNGGRILRNG